MANLTINFDNEINASLQKGDTVLYLKDENLVGRFVRGSSSGSPSDLLSSPQSSVTFMMMCGWMCDEKEPAPTDREAAS